MADQAFPHGSYSAIAKIGVLAGSVLAAALGAGILVINPKMQALTPAPAS
jgi:Na+/H+ antiporter NhaA